MWVQEIRTQVNPARGQGARRREQEDCSGTPASRLCSGAVAALASEGCKECGEKEQVHEKLEANCFQNGLQCERKPCHHPKGLGVPLQFTAE